MAVTGYSAEHKSRWFHFRALVDVYNYLRSDCRLPRLSLSALVLATLSPPVSCPSIFTSPRMESKSETGSSQVPNDKKTVLITGFVLHIRAYLKWSYKMLTSCSVFSCSPGGIGHALVGLHCCDEELGH